MSNRNINKTPMPRVMTELYIILIGLAFGFGVVELSNIFSLELLLRFLVLCAILLIWLHNQIKIGAYEGRNTLFSVGELYLDTASAIFLVSASLQLANLINFYVLISLSYGFDALVEVLFLLEIQTKKSKYQDERARSWTWIKINLISIVVWTFFIFFTNFSDLCNSWILLVIVLGGNIYDYKVHSNFYFQGRESEDDQ